MRYLTTWILIATWIIGELHTKWEYRSEWKDVNGKWVYMSYVDDTWVVLPTENWIINEYFPLIRQTNVKNALDQVNYILYFTAFLVFAVSLKQRNRINYTTITVFLLFMIVDALMYFWNYKTWHYGFVYFGLILVWLLLFFFIKPNYLRK